MANETTPEVRRKRWVKGVANGRVQVGGKPSDFGRWLYGRKKGKGASK